MLTNYLIVVVLSVVAAIILAIAVAAASIPLYRRFKEWRKKAAAESEEKARRERAALEGEECRRLRFALKRPKLEKNARFIDYMYDKHSNELLHFEMSVAILQSELNKSLSESERDSIVRQRNLALVQAGWHYSIMTLIGISRSPQAQELIGVDEPAY